MMLRSIYGRVKKFSISSHNKVEPMEDSHEIKNEEIQPAECATQQGLDQKGIYSDDDKMRYISCIVHDLKTPLQSFMVALQLLRDTALEPEQKELLEHASVSVDLMKLTISQTMDISKTLTGTKLQPRRTTLSLSEVMHKLEIVM